MNKLFDLDSPFMRALSRMGDLMILNILVLFLCIPVITAGAAFTAMHFVLLKIVRGEEGYLVKGFFRSFKQNFRQATILWMLMLFVIALIAADFIIFKAGTGLPAVYRMLILAVAFILLIVAVYIFPVLARFDNTIINTLRNAFFISFLNLPKSILMVLMIFLPIGIAYFFTSYSVLFMILFGFSVPAYVSAYLYSGVFKRFEPEPTQPVSDYDFSITASSGDEETK